MRTSRHPVPSMQVEIYTKSHCPYCERAKTLLRIKGVPFVEHVINGDPGYIEKLHGCGAVAILPGIFIADRLIGGCSELFELDESGELDRLLQATPGSPR